MFLRPLYTYYIATTHIIQKQLNTISQFTIALIHLAINPLGYFKVVIVEVYNVVLQNQSVA